MSIAEMSIAEMSIAEMSGAEISPSQKETPTIESNPKGHLASRKKKEKNDHELYSLNY